MPDRLRIIAGFFREANGYIEPTDTFEDLPGSFSTDRGTDNSLDIFHIDAIAGNRLPINADQ
jgi:hypothetical protein